MDSGPTRVEIELESQEPKRSRRRAAHDVAPDALLDAPPPFAPASATAQPAPAGVPRNQAVIAAIAVGLVALFLGWVLGRSGGEDIDAQPAASTNASTVTTAAPATSAVTDDTLPAAAFPSTTRPRPSTSGPTPAPAWEESTVEIDPRLTGQADRIVGETGDGSLVEVDLASGQVRSLAPFDFTPSMTAFPIFATGDWIMVRSDMATPVRIYLGDAAEPLRPPISDPWSIIWEWGTDRFWSRADYFSSTDDPPPWIEVDVRGQQTDSALLYTGAFSPLRADPAGGLVVTDGTNYFTMDDDGATARLPGFPVAISAGHVLSYVCGDTIEDCGLRLVDRGSSESRPVASDRPLGAYSGVAFPIAGPTVTSDGEAAIVPVSDGFGDAAIALVDVATGEQHEFDALSNDSGFPGLSAAWSADERFAYVLDEGVLTAFDRTSGESFPVIDQSAGPPAARELLRLGSFTVRVAR